MSNVHEYRCQLTWSGSMHGGFEAYDRGHRVVCPPSRDELRLSADAAFHGNPERVSPEQLLLVAASSCQMLSFLALAARARLKVVAYTDEAESVMPEDDKPMRITSITLRPTIIVAGEVNEQRVRDLVERAHQLCFIANSLKSVITVEPLIQLDHAKSTLAAT